MSSLESSAPEIRETRKNILVSFLSARIICGLDRGSFAALYRSPGLNCRLKLKLDACIIFSQ